MWYACYKCVMHVTNKQFSDKFDNDWKKIHQYLQIFGLKLNAAYQTWISREHWLTLEYYSIYKNDDTAGKNLSWCCC